METLRQGKIFTINQFRVFFFKKTLVTLQILLKQVRIELNMTFNSVKKYSKLGFLS